MAYTRDDYLKDLMIVQMGDGCEKTEAQVRVRLYEAGRYTQLNALVDSETEDSDSEYNLYERRVKQIDDRINMAQRIWLNTPSGEHELWMKRNQEYVKIRDEGTAQKEQLWKEYWGKKEAEEREKAKRDARDAVLFFVFIVGGCILLLASCMA